MKSSFQENLHQNFQEETEFLKAVFPKGAAHFMGHMNTDYWYLYTVDFPESQVKVISQPDDTLGNLRHELTQGVMEQSYMKESVIVNDVTHESRI
jgi:hypothetical protein